MKFNCSSPQGDELDLTYEDSELTIQIWQLWSGESSRIVLQKPTALLIQAFLNEALKESTE